MPRRFAGDGDSDSSRRHRDYEALRHAQFQLSKEEVFALDGLIRGRIPLDGNEVEARHSLAVKGYAILKDNRPVRASRGGVLFHQLWIWKTKGSLA